MKRIKRYFKVRRLKNMIKAGHTCLNCGHWINRYCCREKGVYYIKCYPWRDVCESYINKPVPATEVAEAQKAFNEITNE